MLRLNRAITISYAQSFASFLCRSRFVEIDVIRGIILFGSAVRGEIDKGSDIDIFIDISNERLSDKVGKGVEKTLSLFYKSSTYSSFKASGLSNPINCQIGDLDRWSLRRSIISDGIVLYGRFIGAPKEGKASVIVSISPIKDIARRNRVMRFLLGRNEGKSSRPGFLSQVGAKILSPTVFVVPPQNIHAVIGLLKREKVQHRLFDVWSDQVV